MFRALCVSVSLAVFLGCPGDSLEDRPCDANDRCCEGYECIKATGRCRLLPGTAAPETCVMPMAGGAASGGGPGPSGGGASGGEAGGTSGGATAGGRTTGGGTSGGATAGGEAGGTSGGSSAGGGATGGGTSGGAMSGGGATGGGTSGGATAGGGATGGGTSGGATAGGGATGGGTSGGATAGGAATGGGTAGGAPPTCATARPLTNVVSLTAGAEHACVVLTDGGVLCWGQNATFQAGGATASAFVACATPIALPLPAQGLAAGRRHSCAWFQQAATPSLCWGEWPPGALPSPVAIDAGFPAQSPSGLAAGAEHTCTLIPSVGLYCLGPSNLVGQLGVGTLAGVGTTAEPGPAAACGGEAHTCLARGDGGVDCFGVNDAGQVSSATTPWTEMPQRAAVPAASRRVHCGRAFSCALTVTNDFWCWGANTVFQLRDSVGVVTSPIVVASGVTAAGAGLFHTCFVQGSTVSCRGNDVDGQSEPGGPTGPRPQTAVAGLPIDAGVPVELGLGENFSCARYSSGTVWCWGSNDVGQLGSSGAGPFPRPVTAL
ncbi:MAG: hypothetical protein Q8S33_10930 [Myxococcales bacterium]|nr:hypothetical protein [Myxococcales bacterium]